MAYNAKIKLSFPAYTDLGEGANGSKFYIENSTSRGFEIKPNGVHVVKGKLESKLEDSSRRYVIK